MGAGERYRAHFQRYPVIYLTLKGAKQETFERCWAALREKLIELYNQHRHVLDSRQLGEVEERRYRQVLDGTASEAVYGRALLDLSSHLHRRHGERVVMLIDAYDEPIHAGYLHGYAPRVLDFVRTFLTEGLKGNPHLHKAVLTGILRVARESLGRPDVMIRPAQPGRPGVVLELKVARAPRTSLEQALDEGLAQIRARDDAAELRAGGAAPVHAVAVAFDGKVVRVRAGEPG
ncbi:AAA family ATPase [Sorangium sp. So ce1335]|uniref:AAA family ATPase n=1 Tax=Sorangium sp. So ce1335 TaxID=3133335 RepID=UPI003F61824B